MGQLRFCVILVGWLAGLSVALAQSDQAFDDAIHRSDSLVKINPEQASTYADKALELAKTKGDSIWYYRALTTKATCLNYSSRTEEAIPHLLSAVRFFESTKDSANLALSYSRLGSSYLKSQSFLEGIQALIKSNELFESIGQLDQVGRNYGNIGVVYYYEGQYDKAIEFYKKALKNYTTRNERSGIASMYNNIGVCYDLQGRTDSALVFYQKSFAIREELNEKQGMADLLSNIGIIYKIKGDYDKALDHYKRSAKLKQELNDVHGLGITHENLGSLYIKLGEYQKSLEEYRKAEKYYKELNSVVDIAAVYKNIAETYAYARDYKNAFKYLHIHKDLSDSLNVVEISNQINELETQYESEKKDREIDILKKDQQLNELELENSRLALQEKANQEKLLLLALVFLFIVIGFIVYAYLQKRRANAALEDKNRLIAEQKQEVEAQRDSIVDSITYAKRIQNAILPSSTLINEVLPSHFIFYLPKDVVAGDFYWVEPYENKVYVAAADCTGHGVPGAMVSVVCSNALTKALLEEGITDPSRLLDRAREIVVGRLAKSEEVKDGMDISLACIDFDHMTLEWAGANNPLYLLREGEIQITKGDREPIGFTENPTSFTNHKLQLQKGDILYLFTDGYADQFGGPEGKKMGYRRFRAYLQQISSQEMSEQKEQLALIFNRWKGSEEQIDDVCVIGVRL